MRSYLLQFFFFSYNKKKNHRFNAFLFCHGKRYGSILDVAIGKTVGRR